MKTLTTTLLALAVSTSALAYEPQYLNTDNPAVNRLVTLVADSMEFKSSARGPALRQQKHHLAACVLEHLVMDSIEYGIDVSVSLPSDAFDLSQYYKANYWSYGFGVSEDQYYYFNELDYVCRDLHWEPEQVTKRYIRAIHQDEIRQECQGHLACAIEFVDQKFHEMQGTEPEPIKEPEPQVTHELARDDELGLKHLGDSAAIDWIIRMTDKYEKIDLLKNYTHNSIRMYFFCHLGIIDAGFDDRPEFIRAINDLDHWYDNYKSYGHLNFLSHDNREGFQFLRNHCVPQLEM